MRRKALCCLIILCALSWACSKSKTKHTETSGLKSTKEPTYTCRLSFVGDIMLHQPQLRAGYDSKKDKYDFTQCFDSLRPILQQSDISIANLETTLAGKPFRGYPMFSSPDEIITNLKACGINILSTSNNHSADRGKKGLLRTLDILDQKGIYHVGTYRNIKERKQKNPLIIQRNGLRIAFLSYTYGTNGLPIPKGTVIDTINQKQIQIDLVRADSLQADYKIILIHWGIEYQKQANKQQKSLAKSLHLMGANAIIGSHPHVIQGSEWIKSEGKPDTFVLYSLGNFISNQNYPPATRGGLVLSFQISKANTSQSQAQVFLDNLNYSYVFVNKRNKRGEAIYRLLPSTLTEQRIEQILNPKEKKDFKRFVKYFKSIKFVKHGNKPTHIQIKKHETSN